MQGIQRADGQRRGMAIAGGHYAVEFSLHPSVHFDDADLAGGDVPIHLGQDAFGCASLDESFALFTEGNAPHLVEGEPGRRDGWVKRRLLGEVGGVGLREVELAQGGGRGVKELEWVNSQEFKEVEEGLIDSLCRAPLWPDELETNARIYHRFG